MPDDEKITEQEETVEETPDTPADEALAFESDDDDKDNKEPGLEGLEKPDETPEEDKKPDEKPEEDSDEESSEEESEEESEEDPDEDAKRGKDLIADEEKAAIEKKETEEAEKKTTQDGDVYSPRTTAKTAEQVEFFSGVIPKGFFPETVELKDGTLLDFGQTAKDQPEIPIMAAAIAHNIVEQMIESGNLMTNHDVEKIMEDMDNRFFLSTVTNTYDGVPKAQEIFKSSEFEAWVDKQSKEIQVLKRSNDPYDHIRLFKRYLKKEGLDDAKGKIIEIDDKRKNSKKKFDSIHKTTVKSKGKVKGSSMTARELEEDGFNSKDDDDDLYS